VPHRERRYAINLGTVMIPTMIFAPSAFLREAGEVRIRPPPARSHEPSVPPLGEDCVAPTARFVQAAYDDGGVPSAARRIWTCCVNHRIIFGGPGRLDGIALSAFDHDEPALIKTGAEGVVIAGWASGAGVPFGMAARSRTEMEAHVTLPQPPSY
jgi:hypothetical protein